MIENFIINLEFFIINLNYKTYNVKFCRKYDLIKLF
jgi:hypothetical protein